MEKLIYENDIKDNKVLFISTLREIARKLQINPNWLMFVFKKESNLNPKAQNSIKATGLNQMLPKTLKQWNLTPEMFKNMNSIEQLDYVYLFFKKGTGKFKSIYDLYLYNFYPYAVGKPLSYVLGSEISQARAELVRNSNSHITPKKVISLSDYYKYKKAQIIKNVPQNYIDQFQLPENNTNLTLLILSIAFLAFVYFR